MTGTPSAPQMPGSIVLSNTALGVLGFVLTVIAVGQQYVVDASPGVHTAILLCITTFGALGATSQDAARLGKLVPHQIALYAALAANVLQAVSQLSDIGQDWRAAIAGVLVLLASVGINPTSPIRPVPPPQR